MTRRWISRIASIHFVHDDQENIELVAWSRATLEHYCQVVYDTHYPISKAGVGNKPENYTDLDVETVQLSANTIWRIVSQHPSEIEVELSVSAVEGAVHSY